jgi:hypothetical protein
MDEADIDARLAEVRERLEQLRRERRELAETGVIEAQSPVASQSPSGSPIAPTPVGAAAPPEPAEAEPIIELDPQRAIVPVIEIVQPGDASEPVAADSEPDPAPVAGPALSAGMATEVDAAEVDATAETLDAAAEGREQQPVAAARAVSLSPEDIVAILSGKAPSTPPDPESPSS